MARTTRTKRNTSQAPSFTVQAIHRRAIMAISRDENGEIYRSGTEAGNAENFTRVFVNDASTFQRCNKCTACTARRSIEHAILSFDALGALMTLILEVETANRRNAEALKHRRMIMAVVTKH